MKNSWLQVRANEEFFMRLDEIRRAQEDLPTRSEMIRRMVAREFEKVERELEAQKP